MSKRKGQDYDSLESQIGDFGNPEPVSTYSETADLGRLEHLVNRGRPTESEREEMEEFVRQVDKKSKFNKNREESDEPASISEGWVPINREEMGIRSQFYPEDWTFYIRPATVQAIKNWTSIDEERPDQVNTVFNDIIKTCVKISTSTNGVSWQNIN